MDWKNKVRELAKQQRISLTGEEVETFSLQLEDIVNAFNALDQIDTTNVKPSFHPISVETEFREDEPKESTAPTENALRKEKKYLKGPRIIK